jgi:hypothetical protein
MDEAGTSAGEPVTVVVGVITKPDEYWRAVHKEIIRLKNTVPEHYRSGFVFHAKTVWGDPSLREGWSKEDRLKLIADFASIPLRLGLTIALGKVRRDSDDTDVLSQMGLDRQFSLAQWHHLMAFVLCIQKVDGYLRERCAEDEIATLIAEDVPDMRRHLCTMFDIVKRQYAPLAAPGLVSGRLHQGVSRIQDSINFAEKTQAPLLQVADACAFSFRRFFAGQSHGEELIAAMGLSLDRQEWSGPASGGLFSKDPILRRSLYPTDFLE